jgi:tetratricopeptide (TPR) repeat protein
MTAPPPCPDEDSLLAFVEGRQKPKQRELTASHLDGCASCQEVVAAIAPALLSGTTPASGPNPRARAGALERGAAIGRYVVLSLVGRGGMGSVYAAYDPELDRKVALKLLHEGTEDRASASARLLREAKAIARLSHPNVVVVHDAGALDAGVFLAMEFVEGVTLAEWLKAEQRPWRTVLERFLDAGRALAAAHAAGLIHRDFKPQNVMVGADGKVRVMDFGLAALSSPGAEAPANATAAPAEAGDVTRTVAGAGLTRTGTLMGTPAYMAPEQFLAQPVDARSDQFSFCVSLYEGLFGERPFRGDSMAALAKAVIAGEVHEPANRTRAPAWLRRALLRGLQTDRERRYPSMEALLEALERDPARRARRWAAAGAAVALAVGLAAGAHRLGEGQRARCTAGPERFADIWEPGNGPSARRDTIRRAFAASGQPYADHAFTGVARLLDAYVARWTATYTDACEATHVRGEQSEEALDLRMTCLNERLGNVRALSDVFASADAKAVENAVSAAAALPPLDRCNDVASLRAVIKPPDDDATRARVEHLRGRLAQMIALRDAGQCRRAVPVADALIPEVQAVGYQPLLAETLLGAAYLGNDCGDPKVMFERLRAARLAASASHLDEVAALATGTIALLGRLWSTEPAQLRIWFEVARGDAARLPKEVYATGLVAEAGGAVALAEGQYDRALAEHERSVDIMRRTLGPDHPYVLGGELNHADWLAIAGRLEEALAADRAVLEHCAAVLGEQHPRCGQILNNTCEVLSLLGRHAEATQACERSVAILRKSGADRAIIAYALTGLGRALAGQGKPDAAVAPLEESLSLREKTHAPPPLLGETRLALARALWPRPEARPRAEKLVAQAREDLRGEPKALAELEAWVTARER